VIWAFIRPDQMSSVCDEETKTRKLNTARSYDASAAAFVRHPLLMFSVVAVANKKAQNAHVGC